MRATLRSILPPPACMQLPPTLPSLNSSRSLSWKGACSSPRHSQQCLPTSSPTPRPSATTSLSSVSWPPVAASSSSSQGQVSVLERSGHRVWLRESGLGLRDPYLGPFTHSGLGQVQPPLSTLVMSPVKGA